MPDQALSTAQVLTLLSAAPRRLAALTAGLEPGSLRTTPAEGEWSANEVLAHLRACADVWGGCIVTIIAQDAPILRAISPRTWIHKTDYLEQDFQPSLRAFAAQRSELLAVLATLPPEGWSRSATVTGAGKVLEWTVLFYAQRLAVHERAHVNQIERLLQTVRAEQRLPLT